MSERLIEERGGLHVGVETIGLLSGPYQVLPRRVVGLGQVIVGREECRLLLRVDPGLEQITDADVKLTATTERDAFVDGLAEEIVTEAEHPGRNRAYQR